MNNIAVFSCILCPLWSGLFDNGYICRKGDTSSLAMFVLEASRNCRSLILKGAEDVIRGAFFRAPL